MKVMKEFVFRVLATGMLIFFSTCSLEPKSNQTKVYLDLSEITREYAEIGRDEGTGLKASPSTLSGFNCLGVNIIGPGIPDTSANPTPNLPAVIAGVLGGDHCSYRGVVAGPILMSGGSYGSTELELSVPSGPNRVIQIVGVVDTRAGTPACASGAQFANDTSTVTPKAEYYEIGRKQIDLLSSQSIAIANEWPAGGDDTRLISCAGGATATVAPPAIVYAGSPFSHTAGTAIALLTPTNTGGAIATCTAAPPLPAGLAIDPMSCIVSGTPTAAQVSTNHTITAGNAGGTGTAMIAILVNPGPVSLATSFITVGSSSVVSGGGASVVTLTTRDLYGNPVTTGGLTVAFSRAGGVSTGTFGAVTDLGDGTYSAAFSGVLAGSPTTITATINGSSVTSTLPTIAVTPGAFNPGSTTGVFTPSATVAVSNTVALTITFQDVNTNVTNVGVGTVTAVKSTGGGNATFSGVLVVSTGVYQFIVTGTTIGTLQIEMKNNAVAVGALVPLTVTP